jgi:transposase
MPWPSQSPDLNPIENLWSILDLKTKERKPQNEQELFETLETAWYELDRDLLTRLVDTMPERVRKVIESKGFPIEY